MHDRCYGELEDNGCSIWTQSYDYRFIQGLVVCGKGDLPSRLGVMQPKRWAGLCLVRQCEGEGHGTVGSLFGFPGKGGPSLDPLFTRYCGLADVLSLSRGFISLFHTCNGSSTLCQCAAGLMSRPLSSKPGLRCICIECLPQKLSPPLS